jgi:outer membrane protein TolC
LLNESVVAAREAFSIVTAQYEAGSVDFNRYAVIQQNLVQQQDSSAQARGQIAQGLILTYRALGGGWQIRTVGGPESPNPVEPIPAPQPVEPAVAVPLPPVEVK